MICIDISLKPINDIKSVETLVAMKSDKSVLIDQLRKFVAPEIVFGAGARLQAGMFVSSLGLRKVLIVTDPGVEAAGWVDDVLHTIESHGIECIVFDHVTPNPKDLEVTEGAKLYGEEKCDGIVAVGGGSPMDCAKGIGIVSVSNLPVGIFEGVGKISIPGPPLICVPTTAGTSADISQFAIINDTSRNVKMALVSKLLIPDITLVDPQTTLTMSPKQTVDTGFDALTHATEAYVSNASSALTDLLAKEAFVLLYSNLLKVHTDPDNIEFRTQMMLGSMLAGLAFSNASLGMVHAMAHGMATEYEYTHGLCNAILFNTVLSYNFDSASEKYSQLAIATGIITESTTDSRFVKQSFLEAINDLQNEIGIKEGARHIHATEQLLNRSVERAINDPCIVTNPRIPTRSEIRRCYEHAFE